MQKQCKYRRCGQVFETEYPQKEYCDPRCRRAEKDARAIERSPRAHRVSISETSRVENPTEEQLAAFALMYSAGAKNEPTTFFGIIPMWTPPQGILWMWANEEHTERYMMKEVVVDDPIQQALKDLANENATIS